MNPSVFILIGTCIALLACKEHSSTANHVEDESQQRLLAQIEKAREDYEQQSYQLEQKSADMEAKIQALQKEALEQKNETLQKKLAELQFENEGLRQKSITLKDKQDVLEQKVIENRYVNNKDQVAWVEPAQIKPIKQKKTTVAAREPQGRSYQAFYDQLAGHGTWLDVPNQGYCFRPHLSRSRSWRPYTEGYWVWTNCGWYWRSYEPFAWACYHYGYWQYSSHYGWVWMPGDVWGPGWVSWRQYGSYVGWAPLQSQPRSRHSHFSNSSVQVHFSINHFNFIHLQHFNTRQYNRNYCNVTQVNQFFNRCQDVTRYEDHRQNGVNICKQLGGPNLRDVEHFGHVKAQMIDVVDSGAHSPETVGKPFQILSLPEVKKEEAPSLIVPVDQPIQSEMPPIIQEGLLATVDQKIELPKDTEIVVKPDDLKKLDKYQESRLSPKAIEEMKELTFNEIQNNKEEQDKKLSLISNEKKVVPVIVPEEPVMKIETQNAKSIEVVEEKIKNNHSQEQTKLVEEAREIKNQHEVSELNKNIQKEENAEKELIQQEKQKAAEYKQDLQTTQAEENRIKQIEQEQAAQERAKEQQAQERAGAQAEAQESAKEQQAQVREAAEQAQVQAEEQREVQERVRAQAEAQERAKEQQAQAREAAERAQAQAEAQREAQESAKEQQAQAREAAERAQAKAEAQREAQERARAQAEAQERAREQQAQAREAAERAQAQAEAQREAQERARAQAEAQERVKEQ
jgi:hypothetical protein